jgi:hypothetical protein
MYNDILNHAIFFKLAATKEYMRDYMKDRYHRVRQELIDQLGGKCVTCGSKKDLHFDHIKKKHKTFRMSDVHSVSDKRLKKEIKNIQLLCDECHKKKTKESWDFGAPKPQHGTYWMYRQHGCRCDKCADAYKEKNKEWNVRRIKFKKLLSG